MKLLKFFFFLIESKKMLILLLLLLLMQKFSLYLKNCFIIRCFLPLCFSRMLAQLSEQKSFFSFFTSPKLSIFHRAFERLLCTLVISLILRFSYKFDTFLKALFLLFTMVTFLIINLIKLLINFNFFSR